MEAAPPAQQADVRMDNGVRVVRNPKTPVVGPGGNPAAVSLVEDLVIGNDTGREDYWFGFLNALDVDAAGNIYTVDPKSVRIRIFRPDGSLVKAFGRKGQGPGEFSGPGGIIAAADGTIIVSDVLNARLSSLTREGTHLKDTPFGGYRIGGLFIDGRSDLYIADVQPPAGDQQLWDLIKLDRGMKPLSKIYSLSVPFKPRTMNMIPIRLFFGLVGEDRIAWMVSTDYGIRVADGAGKPVMKIFKDWNARKLSENDRASLLKGRFPKGAPAQIEIEFPEYYPAAAGFMTDEKGRIFVRTYETDGKGGAAVDVFDVSGLYVARFFVPEDEDTVTVRNDKLYVILKESASGNPLVKRYALARR
jgi:hypothetical protein